MSTAPPTTPVGTTVVPTTTLTTAVPTTTLTTAAPTTVPPTTLWPPVLLDFGPIEIIVSVPQSRNLLHYNPPMPVNPGLDTSYSFNPIELEVSVEGSPSGVGILVDPIDIVILPTYDDILTGVTLSLGPIDLVVTIPAKDIIVHPGRENWVKWSKIGYLDFTIDESNLAGQRPMKWAGYVWHIQKIGSKIGIYGANGVSMLTPTGVHMGMETVYGIGLMNKGAFAGGDKKHFFVDNLGQLFKIDDKFVKLDYSEYLLPLACVILSYDEEKDLLYICNGTTGYVYSDMTGSFGEGPPTITGLGVKGGNLYVVSAGEITTPQFEICTDIYDLGTRKPKTIHSIEVGSEPSQILSASVDYRLDYREEFKQIGWHIVNPNGKAYPKCYGVEFRFRLKSMIYEYFEVDYLKVRGLIHGFSYLDTVSRTYGEQA